MSFRGPAVTLVSLLVSLFLCTSAHAETDGGLPRRDFAAELDAAEVRASQGHIIEALKRANGVLTALGEGVATPAEAARARTLVEALLAKVAHVTFTVSPDDATDVEVEFDDRRVDPERLSTGRFSVDPGEHEVHARGFSRLGQRLEAHQKLVLVAGETATVALALADRSSACGGDGGDMLCLTEAQTNCMKVVMTEAEAAKCICGRGVAQRPGCHGCVVGRRADAGEAGALAFAAGTTLLSLLSLRGRGRRRRVAAR